MKNKSSMNIALQEKRRIIGRLVFKGYIQGALGWVCITSASVMLWHWIYNDKPVSADFGFIGLGLIVVVALVMSIQRVVVGCLKAREYMNKSDRFIELYYSALVDEGLVKSINNII